MRTGWTLVTCGFVALLGMTVRAGVKPPADYVAAMQTIAAAQDAALKAIKAEDLDAVEKHAGTIVDAFPVVERYWSSKSDVVTMARTAAKAASDLRVSAQQRSVEGVDYSAKELATACGACHDAHREKMPDGTFEVK